MILQSVFMIVFLSMVKTYILTLFAGPKLRWGVRPTGPNQLPAEAALLRFHPMVQATHPVMAYKAGKHV